MADGQRVKLLSDHGADWPLWSAPEGLLVPGSLSLSASLVADLHAWQDLFEHEFHWDYGCRTPEAEARYAQAAPELLHRLRRELGPTVHVTLDAWPVSDPKLIAWLGHRQ